VFSEVEGIPMQRLFPLLFAALLGPLLLGGCNMVYAEAPIFTQADAAGAPQLRPGLWAKRTADCTFDPAKPIADWPECADPSVVTAERVGDPEDPAKLVPYVLAAGDPRVMQLEVRPDTDKPLVWLFAGLKPLKTDAQGRITEARTWMVLCGPPPPPKPDAPEKAIPEDETPDQTAARIQADIDAQMNASVTREPLPGLTIKDGMCVATERDPVRNAARASAAWDEGEPAVIYWVRDQ
jgi:hypothetical protein